MLALFLIFPQLSHSQTKLQLSKPIITASEVFFTDSTEVDISFGRSTAEVWYSLNGEKPQRYKERIVLKNTTEIEAYCHEKGFLESDTKQFDVVQVASKPLIATQMPVPSEKYPNDGNDLFDQGKANIQFNDQEWVGYGSDSLIFKFEGRPISTFGFSTLNNLRSWIFRPSMATFVVTRDGAELYNSVISLDAVFEGQWSEMWMFDMPDDFEWMGNEEFELKLYQETLPEGHPGAGSKAWIFLDEIFVSDPERSRRARDKN